MEGILNPLVSTVDYSTTASYVSLLNNETQQIFTPSKDEQLGRILNSVIRLVLIVFGTIGNGLSFYIMRQGSLKKMSTCFYLSIIAWADTGK